MSEDIDVIGPPGTLHENHLKRLAEQRLERRQAHCWRVVENYFRSDRSMLVDAVKRLVKENEAMKL